MSMKLEYFCESLLMYFSVFLILLIVDRIIFNSITDFNFVNWTLITLFLEEKNHSHIDKLEWLYDYMPPHPVNRGEWVKEDKIDACKII